MAAALATANIRISCVMDFLFRSDRLGLMYGFNYYGYSLTAADAGGSQPVAFSLRTQSMQ
jgi:hypothetical protein